MEDRRRQAYKIAIFHRVVLQEKTSALGCDWNQETVFSIPSSKLTAALQPKSFLILVISAKVFRTSPCLRGPNVGSNFHLIGEIFDKVYSGDPATYTANEETWYTPPGSASVFEFKLEVPGSYTLVDHAIYRVMKGAAGTLIVEGEHDDSIYSPAPTAATAAASGH